MSAGAPDRGREVDASVAVLADRFLRFEGVVKDALGDLRRDFRDGLAQNAATLRTITDPMTGYVPRAQIDLMQQRADAEHARLERIMADIQREAVEAVAAAEKRVDGLVKWLVATALGAAGLSLSGITLALSLAPRHAP